ncbi:MAG: hypothetical protein NVSMB57_11340 [Actinomycetota bacterium]
MEANPMHDQDIAESIERLTAEERDLFQQETRKEILPEDQIRLRAIEVQLDQYWDLLRQRRTRRRVGDDRSRRP